MVWGSGIRKKPILDPGVNKAPDFGSANVWSLRSQKLTDPVGFRFRFGRLLKNEMLHRWILRHLSNILVNISLYDRIFICFFKWLRIYRFFITRGKCTRYQLQILGGFLNNTVGSDQCCGSYSRIRLFDNLIWDPVWVKNRIRIRDEQHGSYFRALRNQFFGLKYFLKNWIRDGKNSDPG